MTDKITEIKRKGGIATIKMESGETLRVPSALFLERRVHTHQQIDPDAYRLYLRERGYPHALEAAMKYLALRERSEQEVRTRLGPAQDGNEAFAEYLEEFLHRREHQNAERDDELKQKGHTHGPPVNFLAVS